jgi:hypothetical protein
MRNVISYSAVSTQNSRATRHNIRALLPYINTYIHMIIIKMLPNIMEKPYPVLVQKLYNMIFRHNLWYSDICGTINTLIDVKCPEGSFESQEFAAADGFTRSLRFVRPMTFPFQKYIMITFDFSLPAV